MRLSTVVTVSCQLLLAASLPISTTEIVTRSNGIAQGSADSSLAERSLAQSAATTPSKATEKEAAAGEAGAAEGGVAGGAEGGAAGGEEAKDPNEKEIEGQFIVPVRLGGANVKQDVLFPPAVCLRLSLTLTQDVIYLTLLRRKMDASKSNSKTQSAEPSP